MRQIRLNNRREFSSQAQSRRQVSEEENSHKNFQSINREQEQKTIYNTNNGNINDKNTLNQSHSLNAVNSSCNHPCSHPHDYSNSSSSAPESKNNDKNVSASLLSVTLDDNLSSPSILPGWHRRPLPSSVIPFSSNRGRQIFKESLISGGMEGYFKLAEQFVTQSEPAYCGPGTLAMVLNSLNLDPRRIWKGNWRWFSEEMLETCDVRKPHNKPLQDVDSIGLSFEEMLFLAECNGAHVQAFKAEFSSESKFRTAIHTATSRNDLHLVASFSRAILNQTGCGHYSPIGGYHAGLDLALVLDVARFKYPPYWAPISLLWRAIKEIDPLTKQGRGYYLMSRADTHNNNNNHNNEEIHHDNNDSHNGDIDDIDSISSSHAYTPLSSNCRIAVNKSSSSRLAQHFCEILPKYLQSLDLTTPKEVFAAILSSLPVDVTAIFTAYTHDLNKRYSAATKSSNHAHSHNDERSASSCATNSNSAKNNNLLFSSYPTFLSPTSPHTHAHKHLFPIHHTLKPLLQQIETSPLFQMIANSALNLNIQFPQSQQKQQNNNTSNSCASTCCDDTGNNNIMNDDNKFYAMNLVGGLGIIHDREAELELATLLLFACPSQIFHTLSSDLQSEISELRDFNLLGNELKIEIKNLRNQLGILTEVCNCTIKAKNEAKQRLILQAKLNTEKLTNETVVSPGTTNNNNSNNEIELAQS